MTLFTLYTTALSANGRKPLALCRYLELDVEVIEVDVYAGEGQSEAYRRVHPLGQVPALVDDDFTLWESNAILSYIDQVYGGMRLSSPDPIMRADIARWQFWEACTWQPACNAVLAGEVAHRLTPGVVAAPTEAVRWEDPDFGRALGFLDHHLANRQWLCSDQPTVADFAVAGMTTYFRAAGFPEGLAPNVAAWLGRMEGLDAWRSTAIGPWAPTPS